MSSHVTQHATVYDLHMTHSHMTHSMTYAVFLPTCVKLTEAMGNHSQGEPDSALQNHQPHTKGEKSYQKLGPASLEITSTEEGTNESHV